MNFSIRAKKSLRFKTQKRSDFFLHKLALYMLHKKHQNATKHLLFGISAKFTVFGGVLACFIY